MGMAMSENDTDVMSDVVTKIETFKKRFDELETIELLSGEDDSSNAFVTIHQARADRVAGLGEHALPHVCAMGGKQ